MITRWHQLLLLIILAISAPLCALGRRTGKSKNKNKKQEKEFVLKSPAFVRKGPIPSVYTCDGIDISPPLHWENPPEGTRSFALTCTDPDASSKGWFHWVVFNLPSTLSRLPKQADIDSLQGIAGTNTWHNVGWGGPCPPLEPHRYIFRLYALSTPELPLKSNATGDELLKAIQPLTIGKAELVGRYQRTTNK